MHELSIAVNVVETVEEYAIKNNAEKVHYIELDIGELSGVVIDALEFAMEEAKKTKICSNAEIKINFLKAKSKCNSCGNIFEVEEIYANCPECGNFTNSLIQGKELNLKKILV